MAGTAGRSTSDSPDAQQLYEAADAAKEAAEADNLLDFLEIERSVTNQQYISPCSGLAHRLCANKSTRSAGRYVTTEILLRLSSETVPARRLKKDDADKRRRGQTEADKKPSGKTLPRTFTLKPTSARRQPVS